MYYYRSLPDGTAAVQSWTIYDLVDDWILHSSIKPGNQILIFLLLVMTTAGTMIWIAMQYSQFPPVPVGAYIVMQPILLVVTIVMHELCHAYLILYYGGRPRFGWKWLKGLGPVIFATTKGYYSVRAYRRIAAAPLVAISFFCLAGSFFGIGWWLIFPFLFNAIGAGGDLLSLRVLKRYPPDFLIEDTEDGFTVYRSGSGNEVSLSSN